MSNITNASDAAKPTQLRRRSGRWAGFSKLMHRRSALAAAAIVAFALASAAPASAHGPTRAEFKNSACGGWSWFPARCGLAEVDSSHTRIIVADTSNDGHAVYADWIMKSGTRYKLFDPDDSGTNYGAWTVAPYNPDRIRQFRVCVTNMDPFTGAPACSDWVIA